MIKSLVPQTSSNHFIQPSQASGIDSFFQRNRVLIAQAQLDINNYYLQIEFKIFCDKTIQLFYATWICLCLGCRLSLHYLQKPGKERELSRLERSLDRDDTARLAGAYAPSARRRCSHGGETVSICRRCCVSAPMTTDLSVSLPSIPPCPGRTSLAETRRKAARIRGILESAHLVNSLFIMDFVGIPMRKSFSLSEF